jgi:hypothetical protein
MIGIRLRAVARLVEIERINPRERRERRVKKRDKQNMLSLG